MMKVVVFILSAIFPLLGFSQLSPDKYVYDHGNIELFNNDTAYFTFTNSSAKTIYLLTTQPNDDYSILVPSKTIEPNSTWTIGVVYYTGSKGKFNIKVPLFFSHLATPLNLEVKGNIKSVNETAFTKCPSIENSKPLQAAQIPLSIIVKDEETQEILTNVHLTVRHKNFDYTCVNGFQSKTYKCKVDYGLLKISADKKDYESKTLDFKYDANNYTCIIELKKSLNAELIDTVINIKNDKIDIEKKRESITKTASKDSIIEPEYIYIPSSVADSGFNSYRYKPNHLIFIVDISGSMKDSGKLDYLKASMSKLISNVRPQDHITLITYNSKVRIIFENYSGTDRQSILKAIDTLSAKGGSNGAQSIQMAYDLAKNYFIKGGNNQIFLATDGLFNSSKISDDDLYKLSGKYYIFHNVKLSTIGFGKDEKALSFLTKLSKWGHGNFLTINQLPSDMDILINEVKAQSLSK